MTARTRIMVRCISRIDKRGITVTVSTAGRTNRDTCMAGIGRMGRLPGASMTGDTVSRCRIADG